MYTYEMKMLSVKKRSGNANYAINNTVFKERQGKARQGKANVFSAGKI